MNKELYVSSTPHETKVALVEDDQLAEVFFERENEYTLAGSIYKGRVTRVLPGMQSAFVDIGLERDAFLYVSDFLELTGDEDEVEEFGEIPAPRGAIEFGKSPALPAAQTTQTQAGLAQPETEEEESESSVDEISETEEPEAESETAADEREGGDGARRWRGRRRRRGGRRGRGFEQEERSEPQSQAQPQLQPQSQSQSNDAPVETSQPRPAAQPRAEYGPPAGYAPMILPGESISKYRNLAQPAAAPEPGGESDQIAAAAAEQLNPVEENANAALQEVESEIVEEATHLDQGYAVSAPEQPQAASSAQDGAASADTEPGNVAADEDQPPQRGRGRWWRSRRRGGEERVPPSTQSKAAQEDAIAEVALSESAASPTAESATQNQTETPEQTPLQETSGRREAQSFAAEQQKEQAESEPEAESQTEHEVDTPGGNFELAVPEQHAAPSVAPKGRTLEHEVIEEEEADFQPMPDDLSALREVAGDEELVLEEETLDANGFSERWVPQIEDVDEDEVVAAEERGEKIYEAEEEEEENGEQEETAERAELRTAAPTAGYQQRSQQRPGYERRGYRDYRRGGPRRNFRSRPNNSRNQPLITDLLKEGQEVLIQIAKEPIGKKGARITSHIALPGRFLVYMPTVNHVGVSRKIASDEERQRLKRIVTSERENGLGGFIVRTAAANIKEEDLRADIRFLKHLWAEIKNRAENSKSPALIYHDLNLVERVLRDQVNADFSQIWVDTEDEYERVVRFANRFQPSLVRRIKLYTKDTPLFEQFGIQEEINRSLKSKVWLKSGGHIVINQTEALVAIDVNTGKFVGKTQRLEDTIVKVNVDAIKEIVRQVRLRDLGGIIVIDFIDMDERKNRQKVMVALEEALRNDRAPSKVLQFNDFGLVAITRKRVKQSLERTLGEPCPYCTGAGFVKSVPTVANELYIEMRKMAKVHDMDDITLRVNPEVAKYLKANNGKLITELEDLTGKTVLVKSDPALHQEMFDIH